MKTLLRFLRAGIGAILHLLALFLKIVYNILKFFRVRILALYLTVCGIVQLFFHTFSGWGAAYFWVGFALCALITVYGWVRFFREKNRRDSLDEQDKIVRSEERAEQKAETAAAIPPAAPTAVFPRYFEVEGHAGYMFAEYEDRYELFLRRNGGWDYIRTDYKEKA